MYCTYLFPHYHTIITGTLHEETSTCTVVQHGCPSIHTHLLQKWYNMLLKHCDVLIVFLLCLNYLLNHFASHKGLGSLLLAWRWCGGLWDNRGLDTHRDSLDTSLVVCGTV